MRTKLDIAIGGMGAGAEKYRQELTGRMEALYETVEKMVGGAKVVMDVIVQTEETKERVGWIECEVKR